MKVIPLTNNLNILAKEIEELSKSNNITTSNLIFNQEDKIFHILVFCQDAEKKPKKDYKIKKETLEKWKSEYPTLEQIQALKKMGYPEKEANAMSKFKAHKLIGEKYGSGQKS